MFNKCDLSAESLQTRFTANTCFNLGKSVRFHALAINSGHAPNLSEHLLGERCDGVSFVGTIRGSYVGRICKMELLDTSRMCLVGLCRTKRGPKLIAVGLALLKGVKVTLTKVLTLCRKKMSWKWSVHFSC